MLFCGLLFQLDMLCMCSHISIYTSASYDFVSCLEFTFWNIIHQSPLMETEAFFHFFCYMQCCSEHPRMPCKWICILFPEVVFWVNVHTIKFAKYCQTASKSLISLYITTSNVWESLFPQILANPSHVLYLYLTSLISCNHSLLDLGPLGCLWDFHQALVSHQLQRASLSSKGNENYLQRQNLKYLINF